MQARGGRPAKRYPHEWRRFQALHNEVNDIQLSEFQHHQNMNRHQGVLSPSAIAQHSMPADMWHFRADQVLEPWISTKIRYGCVSIAAIGVNFMTFSAFYGCAATNLLPRADILRTDPFSQT